VADEYLSPEDLYAERALTAFDLAAQQLLCASPLEHLEPTLARLRKLFAAELDNGRGRR
jgi:hypothetical protein